MQFVSIRQFILLTFALITMIVQAGNKGLIKFEQKPTTANSNRPRCPSKSFIECYYNDSMLSFTFSNDIQSFDLVIEDEDSCDSYYYYITRDNNVVYLPTLNTSYTLTCTTNNQLVYEGILSTF